ncbi:MAG: LON peptidase substrate-binding domain-containing protein, partial [Gammaproteobacteria bacterium]|nr:LON peptidase substrate-binding domain-containing protein [Gammaproteobacteria bacterium]
MTTNPNDDDAKIALPQSGSEAARAPSLPDDMLIILPVRNLVLFPGVILPVAIKREKTVAGAQEAVRVEGKVGFLLQRDAANDDPSLDDLHRIGTAATIVRYVTAPDGTHHLVCQGERRFRVLDAVAGFPYLVARVEYINDTGAAHPEVEARTLLLKQKAVEAITLLPQAPAELANSIQAIESPGTLADTIASFLDVKPAEKQELLETTEIRDRLERVSTHLTRRVEVLKLSRQIEEQTKEAIDDRQREYVLREQLKQIQKELGEESEAEDAAELAEAITEAKMPPEVDEHARKELKRLERMNEASGEYSMARTYLDTLIALPWSKLDAESIDIQRARGILDADHYGLEKIKKRILEYLAVRKLNPEGRSPILCFVGPPGVGKTSLGQSIARAVGLKFQRASLGGTHDEAEIRGHRRTYIGALPGNIIQAIRKAGTRNPVLMLDEIDKLGHGIQGDPAS